uniref:Zinc finger protein 845 n=1 Tax=Cacopsylla melanoneura TaxID=428564 RepID=A0A8D8SMF1_9HEMI
MALESSSQWLAQPKSSSHPEPIFIADHHREANIIKVPKLLLTQGVQTNRFTSAEQGSTAINYRTNCVQNDNTNQAHKEMFDPSMQQSQQSAAQQQAQMYVVDKKNSDAKVSSVSEFPFCYNVNMLQKQASNNSGSSGLGAAISSDDKGCYRFDVGQPFTYNYALVNQMSLAAAANTAQFKCEVCGLVFGHLSLLNHHKRIHNAAAVSTSTSNTNNANTNTNNNTNSNNTAPIQNQSQQETQRTYSCEQCGTCFNHSSELKSHKLTAHPKPNKNCNTCGVELDCEHYKGKKKYIKCENCSVVPTNSNNYSGNDSENGSENSCNTSKGGSHPVKRRGMATVTKCHKCNGSGIVFVGGIRAPIDKPFHCNVCDGSFSRYSSLWSHKRLHTGDKPFKCDICGLAFARQAYLKNHGRVHSGEKPYKCNICGMLFSQSPHLKNHERIHSGERPYQCEVCEKTFARHSTLWNHRRIHTGEKPYRCTICGSSFNQATHLKNHSKVHTGEKPHHCDICDVGFSDKFALKRHRLIHDKYARNSSVNLSHDSQTTPPQSTPTHSASQLEEWKCEVSNNIAFPGCSRPPDTK